LNNELENFKAKLIEEFNNSIENQNKELDNVKTEVNKVNTIVEKISNENDYINTSWRNKSIKYRIFLTAFYNMYYKAMEGNNYSGEMDIINLSLEPNMLINKDLPVLRHYKNKPPFSLDAIANITEENYSNIIIENLKVSNNSLKNKILIAINSMFKIESPVNKLKEGTVKYNLAKFIEATKTQNLDDVKKYSILLSTQSPWFRDNMLPVVKARYEINTQLQLIKYKIEEEIYRNEISNDNQPNTQIQKGE
jgi:hypothetical protein